MAAIEEVAMNLLATEGVSAVGLRAVARELGLTAPALYRYVASHQDLIDLLTTSIYDELARTIVRAARRHSHPGAQIEAASRAFRRWALKNRPQFDLAFATPFPDSQPGKQSFTSAFAGIFAALWSAEPFPVPDEAELSASLVRQLKRNAAIFLPGLPIGAVYVFVWCWARLYGAVCLEIFGHLQWAVEDGQAMFEQTLQEIGERLGL